MFVVPLPPPVHGSNLMNQCVLNCDSLYELFDVKVLPLHYACSIGDIGKVRFKKGYLFIKYAINIFAYIYRFRPDAVYFVPAVTGVSFLRDLLISLIIKVSGIEIIYHLHGKGFKEKSRNPIKKIVYKLFFKNAKIILLSKRLFSDISDVAEKKNCRYLANGIKAEFNNFSFLRDEDNGKPKILFISNLHESKGPLILLEACYSLKKWGKKFEAVFIGNCSASISKDSFESKIKKMDLEDCVRFLGPKYGDEKLDYLLAADIMAFPSMRDAFPLVLLEGMAAGLPIVSTREGAIPDIVDEGVTGFLVEKADSGMLAEKLRLLIEDPAKRKAMGKAGKNKFRNNYTVQSFYKNFINILEDFIYEN